jgi:redox-sensitive bicupin YhaK (pirin superfamily)
MATTSLEPRIDVRRGGERFRTRTGWLDSRHSFSFGPHYDPANVWHGVLVVNNDDVVEPRTGFDTHPHRDMEIVTWVLRGSLVHRDSAGRSGVVYPGLAQRMTAGTGILHSERNDTWREDEDTPVEPVHFVQMWVLPDEPGLRPGYEQLEIDDELSRGGLVPVASGRPGRRDVTAIRINIRDATMYAARLRPGQSVTLPDAPYLHLFVPRGTVRLEGAGALAEGDAVRFTAAGGQKVTADDQAGAEILVWEMHRG